IDLDPAEHRDLARRLAEDSIVLLEHSADTLPLNGSERIAVVGPLADTSDAMLGCYSFPAHLGRHHPDVPQGVKIPTVLESLRAELPDADLTHAHDGEESGDPSAGLS